MDCDEFIKRMFAVISTDYSLTVQVKVKPKRTKKVAKVTPVHNHPLSTKVHSGCPLCQSHGNIMMLAENEYEIIL